MEILTIEKINQNLYNVSSKYCDYKITIDGIKGLAVYRMINDLGILEKVWKKPLLINAINFILKDIVWIAEGAQKLR